MTRPFADNTYYQAHVWISGNHTKTGVCEICNSSTKTQWSNKSGKYRQERSDWQELCRKCHYHYDRQPHMRGTSYRAGLPNDPILQIRNVELGLIRKLRIYAVSHGMTNGEVVEKALQLLLAEKQ